MLEVIQPVPSGDTLRSTRLLTYSSPVDTSLDVPLVRSFSLLVYVSERPTVLERHGLPVFSRSSVTICASRVSTRLVCAGKSTVL